MDKEIIDFLSEYNDEIICSFIIGSYVYSNNFNDIDIVVISKNDFFQKHKKVKNIELKATFLPEKMLYEDLKNDTYGSFIYGRFLNPIMSIKNSEYAFDCQKKAIKKEFKYHKNIIEEITKKEIIKSFILNRGLYFSKYLKNLDVIENENKNIKSFCNIIINIYNEMNFVEDNQYTRSSENIFNYWKTRFSVKSIPFNLNDIIKLYNFKLNENNIIEGKFE